VYRPIPWQTQPLLDNHRTARSHTERQPTTQRGLCRQHLAGEDEGMAPEQLGDGAAPAHAGARGCQHRIADVFR
jgi:hypothetical protein